MSINVCVVSGNLTRDPEVKSVGETKVAKLGLAVNRFYKGEKKVTFVDVEVWGKQADFVEEFLKKGSAVVVESELRQDIWDDKDSGEKRSKHYLVADRVESIGSKSKTTETEAPKGEEVPF